MRHQERSQSRVCHDSFSCVVQCIALSTGRFGGGLIVPTGLCFILALDGNLAEVASRSRPTTLAGASLWSVLSYKPWRLSCAIDHVRVEDVPPDLFQVGNRGDCSTPKRRIVKISLGAPGCCPLIAVPHILGSGCERLSNVEEHFGMFVSLWQHSEDLGFTCLCPTGRILLFVKWSLPGTKHEPIQPA